MRKMVAQKEIPSSNESDDDKRRSVPGLTLWIMLAINHHELPRMETTICRVVMESGLDLLSCDILRARGKHIYKTLIT